MRTKLSPSTKHNIFHHLAMIIYAEVLNLVWMVLGLTIATGGFTLAKFSGESIFRIAIGLPLLLTGVSVFLFKIHELILVLVRPKRLQAICIFCQNNKLGTTDDR